MDTQIPTAMLQLGGMGILAYLVIKWGGGQLQKSYDEALKALQAKEEKLEQRNDEIFALMRDLIVETKTVIANNTAAFDRFTAAIEARPFLSANGQGPVSLRG